MKFFRTNDFCSNINNFTLCFKDPTMEKTYHNTEKDPINSFKLCGIFSLVLFIIVLFRYIELVILVVKGNQPSYASQIGIYIVFSLLLFILIAELIIMKLKYVMEIRGVLMLIFIFFSVNFLSYKGSMNNLMFVPM